MWPKSTAKSLCDGHVPRRSCPRDECESPASLVHSNRINTVDRTHTTLLVVLLALLGWTDGSAHAQSPWFEDVTASHLPQAPELHTLDVSFSDVDGDGDLDAVIAVEHGPNRLYVNDDEGRLTHREGAFGEGVYDTEHVRTADFNEDGNPDVIFVAEDDRHHQYFLGREDGTFRDVTRRLPERSEGNALDVGDVDGDGRPDVVVGNTGEEGQNLLWLNNPEQPGHFVDATSSHLPQERDQTQGIVLEDIDDDQDLDMVVGNEVPPNRLLVNDGSGHFSDQSGRLDVPVPLHTRQVLAFDATGDERVDIVYCNLTSNADGWEKDPQTRLLVQDEEGQFTDETGPRMSGNNFSTYACTNMDADGDGDQDLILSTIDIPGFEPLPVRAYANDGNGNFTDVTGEVMPPEAAGRNWGTDVGDLDGDGIEDLFIGGFGTQARLLLGRRPE